MIAFIVSMWSRYSFYTPSPSLNIRTIVISPTVTDYGRKKKLRKVTIRKKLLTNPRFYCLFYTHLCVDIHFFPLNFFLLCDKNIPHTQKFIYSNPHFCTVFLNFYSLLHGYRACSHPPSKILHATSTVQFTLYHLV